MKKIFVSLAAIAALSMATAPAFAADAPKTKTGVNDGGKVKDPNKVDGKKVKDATKADGKKVKPAGSGDKGKTGGEVPRAKNGG